MSTTREEHIQAIRAACIKANPEIVRITFGCEFRSKTDGEMFLYAGMEGDATVYVRKDCKEKQHLIWKNLPFGREEIIGRPIRLADVLFAIGRSEYPYLFQVSSLGAISCNGRVPIQPDYWDLRKDDLTAQSDETLSFLASLLA